MVKIGVSKHQLSLFYLERRSKRVVINSPTPTQYKKILSLVTSFFFSFLRGSGSEVFKHFIWTHSRSNMLHNNI
jgi:hypothetical protein